jgi:MinD-like ATPase involved in chromosome partitioning or flagellar assembly
MDEDAGSSSPKTLADVSHLFFSDVGESAEEPPEAAVRPGDAPRDDADAERRGVVAESAQQRRTLVPFGRVALFDADPRIPNARYFLGLPSWHYLSPLTGAGAPAPNIVTDSGVVVTDWSSGGKGEGDALDAGGVIYMDVPESGRTPMDFVVVDVPVCRTELLSRLAAHASAYIVTARPGRRGFEHAFVALKRVRRESNRDSAALVVNGASSESYARAFHAKMEVAAKRLLSVDVHLLGAVLPEPGLGAEQRERGAIVSSRPDAASALSLRQIASNVLELTRSDGPRGGGTRPADRRED